MSAKKPGSYGAPWKEAFFGKYGISIPWRKWLNNIDEVTSGLNYISYVSVSSVTGTDQAVDTTRVDNGDVVFYFYAAVNDQNIRVGFLYFPWYSTTLPNRPGAQDIEIGDTDDLYFEISSDGTTISLTATCTETYEFKAIKILL